MTAETRSHRAERRSAELLAAAARLMEREGSQAVSMQAVADEAGVSVGLIYRYFGGKDDLLLAVIVDVLEAFASRVPAALADVDDDPARRLAAAFGAFCAVIDEHRHAAVLTYRETKTLTATGRERIKDLEVATSEPLRDILRDGIERGVFRPVDVDLVAYNLLLAAHGWALKHWYLERTTGFVQYVAQQTSLVLHAVLDSAYHDAHRDLLHPDAGH